MTARELLDHDMKLHTSEAGPEPRPGHGERWTPELYKRWNMWWLDWYQKPMRRHDRGMVDELV
jgi:hypothetical protein